MKSKLHSVTSQETAVLTALLATDSMGTPYPSDTTKQIWMASGTEGTHTKVFWSVHNNLNLNPNFMKFMKNWLSYKHLLHNCYIKILQNLNWTTFQYSIYLIGPLCGRAIAQAVSRWLPTAAARGSSPGLVMWDLWWTKWRRSRFSPSTSVPTANLHSTNAPQSSSSIIWGLYNRPEVAAVPGT
jgi:hypothetical protein